MKAKDVAGCVRLGDCLAGFEMGAKWAAPAAAEWLLLVLLLVSGLASGCMTSQAESDLQWKQYNPTWERSGPGEPYQWGVPFWRP
jgi:hypothetical protein